MFDLRDAEQPLQFCNLLIAQAAMQSALERFAVFPGVSHCHGPFIRAAISARIRSPQALAPMTSGFHASRVKSHFPRC